MKQISLTEATANLDSVIEASRQGPIVVTQDRHPIAAIFGIHEDDSELHLAIAVKAYEQQLLSQSRAAELAGLSRAEFLAALDRYGVSPFQNTADELLDEIDSD